MSRLVRVVAIISAVLIAAGCAVVPTSGPINHIAGPQAGAGEPVVGVIARPPRPGMTPTAIVAGYLDAMASPAGASPGGSYAIARQYLTPGRAQSWDPNLRTVVYDGPGTLEQEGTHLVRLTSTRVGTIDSALRWSAADSADAVNVTFGLIRIGKDWRIESSPDGLLLTGGDVSRGYRGFPIYFVAPNGKVLVADGALIPAETANTATLLTRLLLRGPSGWLAGAVTTGFPRGTALELDSVPVVGGVADVNLNSRVLAAKPQERVLLAAQLTSTLSAVPGVFSVSISVAGQPLPIAGQTQSIAVDQWRGLLPDAQSATVATFMSAKGARILDGSRVTSLTGAERIGVTANPILNLQHTRVAGLTAKHVAVLAHTDGSRRVTLSGSGEASGLAFDRNGLIWGARSGSLLVWDTQGQPMGVITPRGLRVDRFAIAPDGVRIAISRIVGGASQLVVGAITRRPDGMHISGLHAVSRNPVSPTDLAWADEIRVAVLVVAPTVSIFTVDALSGENVGAVAVQQAVDITASARGEVLVGTALGTIWQTSDTFAQQVTSGREPSYGG